MAGAQAKNMTIEDNFHCYYYGYYVVDLVESCFDGIFFLFHLWILQKKQKKKKHQN